MPLRVPSLAPAPERRGHSGPTTATWADGPTHPVRPFVGRGSRSGPRPGPVARAGRASLSRPGSDRAAWRARSSRSGSRLARIGWGRTGPPDRDGLSVQVGLSSLTRVGPGRVASARVSPPIDSSPVSSAGLGSFRQRGVPAISAGLGSFRRTDGRRLRPRGVPRPGVAIRTGGASVARRIIVASIRRSCARIGLGGFVSSPSRPARGRVGFVPTATARTRRPGTTGMPRAIALTPILVGCFRNSDHEAA